MRGPTKAQLEMQVKSFRLELQETRRDRDGYFCQMMDANDELRAARKEVAAIKDLHDRFRTALFGAPHTPGDAFKKIEELKYTAKWWEQDARIERSKNERLWQKVDQLENPGYYRAKRRAAWRKAKRQQIAEWIAAHGAWVVAKIAP